MGECALRIQVAALRNSLDEFLERENSDRLAYFLDRIRDRASDAIGEQAWTVQRGGLARRIKYTNHNCESYGSFLIEPRVT